MIAIKNKSGQQIEKNVNSDLIWFNIVLKSQKIVKNLTGFD